MRSEKTAGCRDNAGVFRKSDVPLTLNGLRLFDTCRTKASVGFSVGPIVKRQSANVAALIKNEDPKAARSNVIPSFEMIKSLASLVPLRQRAGH